MTNYLETIQAYLQSSYSVQVPADWLDACIEWIRQENGGQMSVSQLQPMVFEQWLMSDLKELGGTCLPADLPMQLSTQVYGPLALQVESMVDVGFPMYGQLQKVKGTLNGNTDVSADKPLQPAWEPKASRMMLLKMTDGQTEVQGMEYRPIPSITANLQPGFKVVVQGAVKCRRGVLMLTADNLQVLGGEVDSLVEANTPVAVLQRAMEASATSNGQNARQEFSGRFINQQDFKQGSCGGGKEKVKTTMSSWHKPAPYGMQPGTSNTAGHGFGGCAQAETKQTAMDDEWEEDLDYGGILNTFDEPMEEEPDVKTDIKASSSSTTMQSVSSSTVQRDHKPSLPLVKLEQRDKPFKNLTATGNNNARMSPRVGSVKQIGVTDDNMWGDDDDFEFAHTENELMSPVIPVQGGFDEDHHGGNISNSAVLHADQLGVLTPCAVMQPESKVKAGQDYKHSLFSADMKPVSKTPLFTKNLPQNSAKLTISQDSSTNPLAETNPPPAKQRKLTSMLTTRKKETNAVKTGTCSQSVQDDVVDLTEGGTFSPNASGDNGSVKGKQELCSIKRENVEHYRPKTGSTVEPEETAELCSKVQEKISTGLAVCRSLENLPSKVKTEKLQDVGMIEQSKEMSSPRAVIGVQGADVPKAVITPFTERGWFTFLAY
ncbi:hypothetical protein V1264_015877 [Littorina saxatilis]|uniref:RecQ-mediated genome instability protein 1 n=1 Tax=Littorina saxatilis TaxID=31220 RepID=A0AAN9GGZ1_9CAEN